MFCHICGRTITASTKHRHEEYVRPGYSQPKIGRYYCKDCGNAEFYKNFWSAIDRHISYGIIISAGPKITTTIPPEKAGGYHESKSKQ